ncbi:hypothetical protein TWF730_010111 [Orbilia blumenaviensis]|uniref:Uncharacterized protein n=1 Tax=Orbilia blumenaviensis TaxID=1796055 RepID=A0AAV9UWX5_9PEZI
MLVAERVDGSRVATVTDFDSDDGYNPGAPVGREIDMTTPGTPPFVIPTTISKDNTNKDQVLEGLLGAVASRQGQDLLNPLAEGFVEEEFRIPIEKFFTNSGGMKSSPGSELVPSHPLQMRIPDGYYDLYRQRASAERYKRIDMKYPNAERTPQTGVSRTGEYLDKATNKTGGDVKTGIGDYVEGPGRASQDIPVGLPQMILESFGNIGSWPGVVMPQEAHGRVVNTPEPPQLK